MRLRDRVIVITGSSRGIGRAVAEACAREGAKVVISSRKAEAVEQAVAELKGLGFEVTGVPADVSRQEEHEKILKHALDNWGRVDVWINNAGLSSGLRPLEEIPSDELAEIVLVNITGTLYGCRLMIPYFREKGGIIINLSGKGSRGEASPFMATYASTKIAIVMLTKSLAKENRGYPLSIHAVTPGMVDTDFMKDVKGSPRTAAGQESLPYVLKALGVPVEEVGRFFVPIAAQQPGKVTGKIYSLLKGWRLQKGIWTLLWYRVTGKIKAMS